MNSTLENLQTWDTIQWNTVNEQVRNLKFRIFMAKQTGNRLRLRRLQKLMLNSRYNALHAVRRATVINSGRKTPRIDKVLVEEKQQRMELVEWLCGTQLSKYQPKPVKRVKIPKPNGKTKPPGIPTITDRCIQAMVLNALEPEWEACFEANSYGFRPGRSPHDAIARVFTILSVKSKGKNRKQWILDADIEGFFDNICHDYILEKLDNFPGRHLIQKWLKAGYMEKSMYHPTELGTTQGGIISPLLANIALHGLESYIGATPDSTGRICGTRNYIRYANDFIVLCSSEQEAKETKDQIANWLKQRGLRFAPDKIHIHHIEDGFDFLGVNIRHFKTRAKHKTQGKVLLIRPSTKSIRSITQKLRNEWQLLRGKSITEVLNRINPIITGWANYHRKYDAINTFRKLDNWTFQKSWEYASRAHGNKSKYWIYDKYFGNFNLARKDRWTFGDKETGNHLKKFAWFNVQRHIMVKGAHSPCDPKLKEYWEGRQTRLFKATSLPSELKIAKQQDFKCPVCADSLYGREALHKHHLIPRKIMPIDNYWNLVYVHHQCYQQLHAQPQLERQLQKILFEMKRAQTKRLNKAQRQALGALKDELFEHKA
uniref:Reverse transcriptase domain-containing protein n=1 Tax=Pseudobryopsis hainanensis TaxID=2320808 RepID=A0A386AXU4_9CHLO|nr:hypothetical protein [Pseudobryopsis hainanensis]